MKELCLFADVTFAGAVDLEESERGLTPWRLPLAYLPFMDCGLAARANSSSGVRICFISDAESVSIVLSVTDADEQEEVDLVIDGELVRSQQVCPDKMQNLEFPGLGGGLKRIELYLPAFGITTVASLKINAAARAFRWDDTRPRWITYGSSITHCRRAHSPAQTWPALVAREFNLHFTSLGFGGQCMADQVVARTIAAMPADFISLCLGINTGGGYSPRTWLPTMTGFFLTVREAHPEIPILIISPIYSRPRETELTNTGLSLSLMRGWLAELVETLRDNGDDNVHYLDGLEIIGEADAGCMPDELHPDGDGILLMGRRFCEVLPRYSFWPLS